MQLITSALDLVGAVLLILAAAWFIASWTIPGALAAAGVLVLLLSFLIDRRGAR